MALKAGKFSKSIIIDIKSCIKQLLPILLSSINNWLGNITLQTGDLYWH